MTDNGLFINSTFLNDDDIIMFSEIDIVRVASIKEIINKALLEDFLKKLKQNLLSYNININEHQLFLTEGMNCECLRIRYKNWKEGTIKIKVSLKFIADTLKDAQIDTVDDQSQSFTTFRYFDDNDVIQFKGNKNIILVKNFKDCCNKSIDNKENWDFIYALYNYLSNNYRIYIENLINIVTKGIDCQLLKLGSQGWISGKLNITFEIEFINDDPVLSDYESPLDEIRQSIQFQQSLETK